MKVYDGDLIHPMILSGNITNLNISSTQSQLYVSFQSGHSSSYQNGFLTKIYFKGKFSLNYDTK